MKRSGVSNLVLTSPWLVTLLLFWAFPVAYSLYASFTDFQLLQGEYNWIGLGNYRELLQDEDFLAALKNTAIFVLGTIPVTTVLSLILALLISRHIKGRTFFRSAFFIPSITSMVVIALVFTQLLSREGYIPLLARTIGLSPPINGLLYSDSTALYSIMAMDVWMSMGYYMLIWLAGLKSIPTELYEAAEISGASRLRTFFSITLPLLRPVALFIVVVNSIKSFQVFVEIFVMTKGSFDTLTTVYFIYEQGLTTAFRIGYASAAAYILLLIIGAFSLLQFRLLRLRQSIW